MHDTFLKVAVKWFWSQCKPVQNRKTFVSQIRGCPAFQRIPCGPIAIHAAAWKSTDLWSFVVGPLCVGSADAPFL